MTQCSPECVLYDAIVMVFIDFSIVFPSQWLTVTSTGGLLEQTMIISHDVGELSSGAAWPGLQLRVSQYKCQLEISHPRLD